MFSMRRMVPRVLSVLLLAAAGTAVATTEASAHTGAFSRDCGEVSVHLTNFAQSSNEDPNVVDIYAGDTKVDTLTFTTSSVDKTWTGITNEGTLTYQAKWTRTGSDNASGQTDKEQLSAPEGCTPPCIDNPQFSYTFDGPAGTAQINAGASVPVLTGGKQTKTATEPPVLDYCSPVYVILTSYSTQGPTYETAGTRTLFDKTDVLTITKPGVYDLKVNLPNCLFEDDLYVLESADFDQTGFDAETGDKYFHRHASEVWGNETESGPSYYNGGSNEACATTTAPPVTTTPGTVAPTTTNPPAAAPPGDNLPNTGASIMPKLGLAAGLLIIGTGLVFFGRRRRSAIQ